MPLVAVILSPASLLLPIVAMTSLVYLAALGAAGARIGGAALWPAIIRVAFWGALAMALTAGIGSLFGVSV